MNYVDMIADKYIFKEVVLGSGEGFLTELITATSGIALPIGTEREIASFSPRISGEMNVAVYLNLSQTNETIRIYKDSVLMKEMSSSLYNPERFFSANISVTAFSKYSVRGLSASGNTATDCYIAGEIKDKAEMYFVKG